MSASRKLLTSFALLAMLLISGEAVSDLGVPVQGQVISRARGPVPGVTVFLVHQMFGRSEPSFTDISGRFGWQAIPMSQEPYFIEIYWGPSIIYRQQILILSPTLLPPILL